jgi:hypothetical protein
MPANRIESKDRWRLARWPARVSPGRTTSGSIHTDHRRPAGLLPQTEEPFDAEATIPGRRLQLSNISVANLSLADVIPAAAAVGFDQTVLASSHRRPSGGHDERRSRRWPPTTASASDLEAAGDGAAGARRQRASVVPPIYETSKLLDVELGAKVLVATHFGAPAPVDGPSPASPSCATAPRRSVWTWRRVPGVRRRRRRQRRVEIVRLADRPNAGILVDNWHHRRSPASDDDLLEVPPERISACSCPMPPASCGSAARRRRERLLIGDGELDVVDFVRCSTATASIARSASKCCARRRRRRRSARPADGFAAHRCSLPSPPDGRPVCMGVGGIIPMGSVPTRPRR